ncbi:PEP-CTERM sorting domain-containing protein [Planctomycetaceae bacterium]|nr:PEP-CTERM sorting domain-containing protein [Planctomycetaceae bacterium]
MTSVSVNAAITLEILDLTNPTTVDPINGIDSYQRNAAVGGQFVTQFFDPDGSSGTGTYAHFLRVQANGDEQGYNTDLNSNYDIKPSFTSPLDITTVPVATIGGTKYLEFSLDINQSGNTNISLNQVQLFATTGDVESFTVTEATATTPAALTSTDLTQAYEFFRLNSPAVDADTHYEILMDYSLNSGSGTADMLFYVEDSLFNFLAPEFTNIVMFSQFGSPPGSAGANSGFEEWAVRPQSDDNTENPFGGTSVPEPGSLVMLGVAAFGVYWRKKRRPNTVL